MYILYYAAGDPNSYDLLKMLVAYPKVVAEVNLVDVMQKGAPPVEYVPTIVDDKAYVGRRAFEWLHDRVFTNPVSRHDPSLVTPTIPFTSVDGIITTAQQRYQPLVDAA